MGVKSIKSLFIVLLLILIMSQCVHSQAVSGDTAILNQINERLERNKAEILKAVKDAQAQSMNDTSVVIDNNFKVLDDRIQEFNKNLKRDIAIVMVASFLVGFAVSQIIRISIEARRRKGIINRTMELEANLEKMTKEMQELVPKIKQLKELDQRYSTELKSLTKKPPFITIQAILLAIITFCVGAVIVYLAVR